MQAHQGTSFASKPHFSFSDIVHENLKMGSDGESDQASGTSSDEVQSPTGVCLRNRGNRRISAEVMANSCWSSEMWVGCESLPSMEELWHLILFQPWFQAGSYLTFKFFFFFSAPWHCRRIVIIGTCIIFAQLMLMRTHSYFSCCFFLSSPELRFNPLEHANLFSSLLLTVFFSL